MQSGPNERRLINDLMETYQNLERPVFNESEALDLKFGLTLQQIIDVVSQRWEIFYCCLLNLYLSNSIGFNNIITSIKSFLRA